MTETEIARVCHEANKGLCAATGDHSQKSWEEAEAWQRESSIEQVLFTLEGNTSPSDQHDNWMTEKVNDGWVYGDVKDPVAKTHPCIVPYDQLPEFQQKKDYLFIAIVNALK